jgi:small-conductance mechanosensitive channel
MRERTERDLLTTPDRDVQAIEDALPVWTNRFEDWMIIRSQLAAAVYAALTDAKILIAFPQWDVHVRPADAPPVTHGG